MSSYLMKNYKGKYNLLAEIDKRTGDFCRDDKGDLENYSDIWIECSGKGRIYHYGHSILQFYYPSLGRGHNILKNIYSGIIGDCDKFQTVKILENGNETKSFDYETMYLELINNGIIFDIEETSEEVLFKFKAKNLESLIEYIQPKTNYAKRSPFSVKNLRKQLGIKAPEKNDIPIDKLTEYKKITSQIGRENISIYNKINDGFITELCGKNNSSKDTFLQNIKDENYTIKGYIFSLGEDVWSNYLEYIKNYLKENQ